MKVTSVIGSNPAVTRLTCDGKAARLEQLGGMTLFNAGPLRTQGLAVLSSSLGRVEGDQWKVEQFGRCAGSSRVVLSAHKGALRLDTRWTGDRESGVISRRDRLTNRSALSVTVFKCQARFAFPPDNYEVYLQESRWCGESQGLWTLLRGGGMSLACVSGRTSLGGTPYACLRRKSTGEGLAFHVLPVGNWAIHIRQHVTGECPLMPVVELGLADENLRLVLAPGEGVDLPELLFQSLPDGEPHLAAPALHRFLLRNRFASAKPLAPIVYNTWFDQFGILDVPRLRRQLAAAKAVGCEVFTIDAGWYGQGRGAWWELVGDWRENTKAAFRGKMRGFADEVRKAGLGFGLWMEPERFAERAPIRRLHPDWFVPAAGGMARIDLTIPAACQWQKQEITRLVKTYRLAWMKIDFNFELDRDASGTELSAYTRAWYRLLEEIRAAHPKTFFEGCASGALRTDLEAISHFDNFFLSDTVHPVDALRIMQGSALRLLPARIGRWAVLRSAGRAVAHYGKSVAKSPSMVLTPCGAGWQPSESMDLHFLLLAAFPGMLGFSGDLAGLPKDMANPLRQHTAFFKKWRRMLAASVTHLLTPPELMSSRSGWMGFQAQSLSRRENLLLVYRLGTPGEPPVWRPRDLDPRKSYRVRFGVDGKGHTRVLKGEALMREGVTVPMPAAANNPRANAAVCSIVAR